MSFFRLEAAAYVCLCVIFLSGRFKDCCVLVDSEKKNAKVINRLVFLFGEEEEKKNPMVPKSI